MNKMTKEEKKAIKILTDLGQSFQTADENPECRVTYTLKSGYTYSGQAISEIIMCILKLIKKQEKENTDLKDIYIRMAKNFEKKGQVETAEYMLAQIEAIPTFTTWEEYTTWVSKDKIREILSKHKNTRIEDGWMFFDDIKKLLEEG